MWTPYILLFLVLTISLSISLNLSLNCINCIKYYTLEDLNVMVNVDFWSMICHGYIIYILEEKRIKLYFFSLSVAEI